MSTNFQMTSGSTIHFLYGHFLKKIKTDMVFVHFPFNSSIRDAPWQIGHCKSKELPSIHIFEIMALGLMN